MSLTYSGVLKKQAIAGIVKYAEALPAEARVSECLKAALYADPDSELERQAVLGFVRAVQDLPDAKTRLFEFRYAVSRARLGSELKRLALSGFVKEVKTLPAEARVSEFRETARRAASGSELKRLAVAEIKKMVPYKTCAP